MHIALMCACASPGAVGLLPPQPIVSDQWAPQSKIYPMLPLLFAFIDTLDCPDLHRPMNKDCIQKSMKDSRTGLHISLFFMNWRYNHTNKEHTWKLSNLITLCASSPSSLPFLCDVSHFRGCKQPPHWLRTSLVSPLQSPGAVTSL